MHCKYVEPGWKCPVGGKPCIPLTCGNGMVETGELCDDKNNADGDGCSYDCMHIE